MSRAAPLASRFTVCSCLQSARLRARAQVQYTAQTMTPTNPTMNGSGSSWHTHGLNSQINHPTAAPTSLATHWRGGACPGARRAANSFVLFKAWTPIHLNWPAFPGDPFELVLWAGFPRMEYHVQRAARASIFLRYGGAAILRIAAGRLSVLWRRIVEKRLHVPVRRVAEECLYALLGRRAGMEQLRALGRRAGMERLHALWRRVTTEWLRVPGRCVAAVRFSVLGWGVAEKQPHVPVFRVTEECLYLRAPWTARQDGEAACAWAARRGGAAFCSRAARRGRAAARARAPCHGGGPAGRWHGSDEAVRR